MTPDDRSESEDKETTKTEYKLITDEKFRGLPRFCVLPTGLEWNLQKKACITIRWIILDSFNGQCVLQSKNSYEYP